MINYSHGRISTNRMYAVPVGEQQMPAMELFLLRKGMCSSLQRDADKVILVGTLR